MRVICIEVGEHIPGHEHVPVPIVGSIYNVIDEGWDEDLDWYYCLAEFGDRYGFSQGHFAPLDDDTDTPAEVIEEEETETA